MSSQYYILKYILRQFAFILITLIGVNQTCSADSSWVTDSLSLLNRRIQVARQSNNREIILKNYFGNHFSTISSWTSKNEDFQKVTNFLQQGIDYAKSINAYDYVAIGYTQKATTLRRKGDNEKALGEATTALWDFENTLSDSVKTIVYIEIGNCYQARNDFAEANKYYNKAFDKALQNRNHTLEARINFNLADLYYQKEDPDIIESTKYLYKNVALHTKFKDEEGLINTYTQLGRVTDNISYIDTVFLLATSKQLQSKTLAAKKILLAIYGFVQRNTQKALNYMNSESDLKNFYLNGQGGAANYYFYIGQLFSYNNSPDSALFYIKKAEPGFLKDSLIKNLQGVTSEIAKCYEKLGDQGNAINYYKKSLEYSKQLADLPAIMKTSNALSKLYEETSSFMLAYKYKLLTSDTKDSLSKLTRERDMFYMEMYRETKKHEEELKQEEERVKKKHNLQYMGITIGICILLLIFLLLGMFPVSKLVIRIFGFIYFICVFEFIILLIEHSVLHPITHGDPLKLWLLKIVLIALLVPIQQFLEHRLIKFLQSRKLLDARAKFANRKWWRKKKKVVVKPEETDN